MDSQTKITAYREWLGLDKSLFRILIIIILNDNEYKGNLSDLCRLLNLSPRSKNRNTIKAAINKLTNSKFINSYKSGNTYTLSIIPKETEIKVKKYIIEHLFSICGEGVSKEIIIKTYLWYCANVEIQCTNNEIANELKCSDDTVSGANTFLQQVNAIVKKDIKKYVDNGFITLGHTVTINAWINT